MELDAVHRHGWLPRIDGSQSTGRQAHSLNQAEVYAESGKQELHLDKNIVLNFVTDSHSADLTLVLKYFVQQGAYRRFKDFLAQRDLLDRWYDHEILATQRALLIWAEEHGITVTVPGIWIGA